MNEKYNYQMIKEIVEDLGYELISKEYINNCTNLLIKDKDGYLYTPSFARFKRNIVLQKFDPSNEYTIENLKLWLYLNGNKFILITENYNNKEKLVLKDSSNYYYNIKQSELIYGKTPLRFHKSNPYTIANIKLFLKLNMDNFELINDNYIDSKSKIVLKCNMGYYYSTELTILIKGEVSRIVHKSNSYSIQNIRLWCKLNNKPFELVSDVYEESSKKLKWKCLKEDCKETFKSTWTDISHNRGCSFCRGLAVGVSNCLATKNPELAKEWHNLLNNLTTYDVTCGLGLKVWWKCKDCGNVWEAKISDRNKINGTGCPECNKSKGEKRCKEIFDLNNVVHMPQKEFDGLLGLGNKNLSYDFYVPKYNLLIEFQGIQHEKYMPIFHKSRKDFEKQQEHDRRKREYAKNNNIKLLEIWYWDFDNIESILEKEVYN